MCGLCWRCAAAAAAPRKKPSKPAPTRDRERNDAVLLPKDLWFRLMTQYLDFYDVLTLRTTCRVLWAVVNRWLQYEQLEARFGIVNVNSDGIMANLSAATSNFTVLDVTSGHHEPLLRYQHFGTFDNRNGVYMGGELFIRCADDTFAHHLEFCTSSEQRQQLEKPLRSLAAQFRRGVGGGGGLFDCNFKSVMSSILPKGVYHVCHRTNVLFEQDEWGEVYARRISERLDELGPAQEGTSLFHPSGTMIDLTRGNRNRHYSW